MAHGQIRILIQGNPSARLTFRRQARSLIYCAISELNWIAMPRGEAWFFAEGTSGATHASNSMRLVTNCPSRMQSLFQASPGSPASFELSEAEQRTAITAAASFVPANKATSAAPPIPLLSFRIISASPEIEPDYRIVGTMPLRLRLITKGIQWYRSRTGQCACRDDRH
jgi:hypothetical protein